VLFPHVAFQIALPYLFHDSLSQVVWLIAAANLSLVLCSGVFTLVSWVAVPALARFGFRDGRRSVFSPGRVADQAFLRLNSEPVKEETGI